MKNIFFFALVIGAAQASNVFKDNTLEDGKAFDLPEITEECQPEKKCAEEGARICRSKKAVRLNCIEQYRGNWTTSCKCIK